MEHLRNMERSHKGIERFYEIERSREQFERSCKRLERPCEIPKTLVERISVRLLLLRRSCGAVFGTNGETIKKLRKKYRVLIHIPSSSCDDRLLFVTGEKQKCLGVVIQILKLCSQAPFPVDPNHKYNFELNILVHSDQVVSILGKGGAVVNGILEEGGGRFNVYTACLKDSNECVVAIGGGEEEAVIHTLDNVLRVLNRQPPNSRTLYYSPQNNANRMAGGAVCVGARKRDEFEGLSHQFGAGGDDVKDLEAETERSISMYNLQGEDKKVDCFTARTCHVGGPQNGRTNRCQVNSSNSNANKARSDHHSNNLNFLSAATVTKIKVSNAICGAIVGKYGKRLKSVRKLSGATVELSEAVWRRTERIVSITGTQQQVQIAQEVITQHVRYPYD